MLVLKSRAGVSAPASGEKQGPLRIRDSALLVAESEAGATACRIRDLPRQSPSASTPLRPASTLDVRRAQLSRCRQGTRQLGGAAKAKESSAGVTADAGM
jgi:transposase